MKFIFSPNFPVSVSQCVHRIKPSNIELDNKHCSTNGSTYRVNLRTVRLNTSEFRSNVFVDDPEQGNTQQDVGSLLKRKFEFNPSNGARIAP